MHLNTSWVHSTYYISNTLGRYSGKYTSLHLLSNTTTYYQMYSADLLGLKTIHFLHLMIINVVLYLYQATVFRYISSS